MQTAPSPSFIAVLAEVQFTEVDVIRGEIIEQKASIIQRREESINN